jgi:MFS transporter, ACS family, tartrate transporter
MQSLRAARAWPGATVLGWARRVRSQSLSALDRARHKAYWRLIPLVFLSYVIAYIDRSNVAIAKLTMAADLGFDNAVFARAAGIFFLGYFLPEIPGPIIVERWSARKWISRIMITWGIIAALNAAVRTPGQFYFMRLLLGLAEGGFFPAVIVYLNHWFPDRDRARALAFFIIAAPVAQIVSPLLSYRLQRMGTTEVIDGVAVTFPALWGLQGWQWVYIAWGIPAVVLGVVVIFRLVDRPGQAPWLTAEEKQALEGELARERAARAGSVVHLGVFQAMRNPRVLLLAAANFFIVCGHYGVEFFLATILTEWYGLRLGLVTSLVVLPFVAMMVGQIAVSWSSDRTGERWWHTALPMYAGALALLLTPLSKGSLPLSLACFAVALAGIRSYLAPFYALPRLFLQGAAAAGSIGLINAIANLGGFVGPIAIGEIEKSTGSFAGGILFLAGTSAVSATLIVALRAWHLRRQR